MPTKIIPDDMETYQDTWGLQRNRTELPDVDNAYDFGNPTLRWKNFHGVRFMGVSTTAEYADLAERYEASEGLDIGDIVAIGGDKEIKKASDTDFVLGVISEDPAYLMNAEAGNDITHPPVGLIGRLMCKVKGPATKGRPIYSSSDPGVGYMVKDGAPTTGVYVGICLGEKVTDDVGLVEITLVRR